MNVSILFREFVGTIKSWGKRKEKEKKQPITICPLDL